MTALEPNDDMRINDIVDSGHTSIKWLVGSAEQICLAKASADWLTVTSSFHCADFYLASREFHQVLRAGGHFTVLLNPRFIEANPLLVEIEAHLDKLRPKIKCVSSDRFCVAEIPTEKLRASTYFDYVAYLEGYHIIKMKLERYLGAWRSVKNLRFQLGPQKFDDFPNFVKGRITGLQVIEAMYLTRAWSARRKG